MISGEAIIALPGSTVESTFTLSTPSQSAGNMHVNVDDPVSAPDDASSIGTNVGASYCELRITDIFDGSAVDRSETQVQFRYDGAPGTAPAEWTLSLWALGAQVGADVVVDMQSAVPKNGQLSWLHSPDLTVAQVENLSVRAVATTAGGGAEPDPFEDHS